MISGTWGCHLGTESVTPGTHFASLLGDVAHDLDGLPQRSRDQLSARRYLQTLMAKGLG